jgi:CheY-like chemotaxis protein
MATVLVVEDDDDNRRFLQELLQFDTHQVFTARNGLEALLWLQRQQQLPHCILLDLDMPIMSGQEFVRRVQGEPRFAQIRIIILSGDPHRHLDDLPQTTACLEKPAAPDLLVETVARCSAHPS